MNLATLVLQNIILKWNLDQELNLIRETKQPRKSSNDIIAKYVLIFGFRILARLDILKILDICRTRYKIRKHI